MHLNYPQSSDSYTYEELLHLIKALGFPKDMLVKNIPREMIDNPIPINKLIEMCDLRYFHQDLHYTVNMKSASCNVDILKKCLHQVSLKKLSFLELENIRLAYEMYEEFDQRGMKLDMPVLIKALKLCDRVVAPLKLTNKLRHLQPLYQEKGRIQFCEFLDLLSFCDHTTTKELKVSFVGPTEKTARDVYCLDEMENVILPKDELIHISLNRDYLYEVGKCKRPELKSRLFKEHTVTTHDFQTQVKAASREHAETMKRLQNTGRWILRSKSGNVSSTGINLADSSISRLRSAKNDKITSLSGAPSLKKSNFGTSTRCSSTTAANTYKSAPAAPVKAKTKLKPRAQSSPPVVNPASRCMVRQKLTDLQFNIHTEEQRWRNNTDLEVSKYIYNSDNVLERLRRPPSTPGPRKKRTRVRTQPPPKFTKRMAEPGPLLPRHHVSHCDAIALGLGEDGHATALRRHGTIALKKCNERRKDSHVEKEGSLLQRLLDAHNDSCSEVTSQALDNPDQNFPLSTNHEFNEQPTSCMPEPNPKDSIPDAPPVHISLASPASWKAARYREACELLKNDFSKIFLDSEPLQEYETAKKSTNAPSAPSADIVSLLSLPPEGALEESEFEKYLKSTTDFTIPDEEVKLCDVSTDYLQYRRSFRRLRARSASAKSELQSRVTP